MKIETSVIWNFKDSLEKFSIDVSLNKLSSKVCQSLDILSLGLFNYLQIFCNRYWKESIIYQYQFLGVLEKEKVWCLKEPIL